MPTLPGEQNTLEPRVPIRDEPVAAPAPAPSVSDTVSSAFRTDNTVSSVLNHLGQDDVGEPDPDHDPISVIGKDSVYTRNHLDRFLSSRNERDTIRIRDQIDQELKDRRTLEESGAFGIAASLAAGLIDPVNLIPGGSVYRSVKGGVSVLKTARSAAVAGASAAAISEGILQGTQETRTPEESAVTIGASALLSGVLGAGVGTIAKRSPTEVLDGITRDMELPAPGEIDTFAPGGLSGSVGAARAGDANELDNFGLLGQAGSREKRSIPLNSITAVSPVARLQTSPSAVARAVVEDLAEGSLSYKKASEGTAVARLGSVETRKKFWQAPLAEALEDLDQAFLDYRFNGEKPFLGKARAELQSRIGGAPDKMDFTSFKREVARAMRNGDQHLYPEVGRAAKALRTKVYDPLLKAAEDAGLLPKDLDPQTALSYLNRVYDRAKINARRGEFKDSIVKWLKQARDDADTDTIRAGRSDAEIESLADEIIDRIISTPDGRLPYDAHIEPHQTNRGRPRGGLAGPLQQRMFMIPDNMIADFLENDVEVLSRIYTNSLSADVELTKRFGDTSLVTKEKEVVEEFAQMIEKARGNEKEVKRLGKLRDAAIRDIAGIRDRIRGTHAVPEDPDAFLLRAGRVVRSLNYLRLLGGMTVSAIPDLARSVMVSGLRNTVDHGWVPLIRDIKTFRKSSKELRSMGVGLDMILDSRSMAIADIMDDYGRHSKFERALNSATSNFGVVSLMAPWNAFMKQFSGMVTTARIMDVAEKMATGKRVTKKEIKALANMGIDENLANKIWKEFSTHGEKQNGMYMPKAGAWTDTAAKDALRSAVLREVDRIIVTPGQEMPLLMSNEFAKLLLQFKSFALSSTSKTLLSGLQQRDMAVLNGATMAMALGGLVYAIKQTSAGREIDTDPRVFLAESFDRSGLAGWFMEPHNVVAKLTRGAVSLSGQPLSRYTSRGIVSSFIGPTAGLVEDFASITGDSFAGEFDQKTVRNMRRLLPYQNVVYLRNLLNTAEQKANDVLGVPEKAN